MARILFEGSPTRDGAPQATWAGIPTPLHQRMHVLALPLDAPDEPISGPDGSYEVSSEVLLSIVTAVVNFLL